MTPYGTEHTMRLIIYTFLETNALQKQCKGGNHYNHVVVTAETSTSRQNFKFLFLLKKHKW
jgi:hypothetical protein